MGTVSDYAARHAEQHLSDTLLSTTAYIVVAAGYLTSILTGGRITVAGFAAQTLGTVGWVWFLSRLVRRPGQLPRLVNPLSLGLIAMTLVVLAAPWFGVGLNWLLPVATVAVLATGFHWRKAAALSTGIWFVTALDVAALTVHGSTFNFAILLQNQISMVISFVFIFAFSLVFNLQMRQRARAEALVAELEAAQAQLRASASEAEELAITRERNRMAREIHDTLGHYLTILTVKLETAIKLEEHTDARLREELVETRRVATECLAEVRRSVSALRPAEAGAMLLSDELKRLVDEFDGAAPDVETVLDVEGPVREVAPELRATLYRCAQEALTNVRKHARATRVLVRLRVDERHAELTVLDNGSGGDEGGQTHQPGFGLLGMRERIDLVSGTAIAGPEPGRGWRVEVVVPLAESARVPAPMVEG